MRYSRSPCPRPRLPCAAGFRALILCAALAGPPAAPAIAENTAAGEACPVHDWLAWVYATGEALDRAAAGPDAERTAVELAQAVMQADSGRLLRVMGAVGLEDDVSTVADYLVLLKARLISIVDPAPDPGSDRRAAAGRHPDAERMGAFIEGLECEADPDWRAPAPEKDPIAQPRRERDEDSVRQSLMATGVVLGATTAAAAAVALGAALLALLDQRRKVRHPCRMRAALRTETGRLPAVAVDISRQGAKLRLGEPVADHSRCLFEAGGHALPARVLWSNAHFAGIAFVTPMTQAGFDALLRRHQWDAPAFAHPAPVAGDPPTALTGLT